MRHVRGARSAGGGWLAAGRVAAGRSHSMLIAQLHSSPVRVHAEPANRLARRRSVLLRGTGFFLPAALSLSLPPAQLLSTSPSRGAQAKHVCVLVFRGSRSRCCERRLVQLELAGRLQPRRPLCVCQLGHFSRPGALRHRRGVVRFAVAAAVRATSAARRAPTLPPTSLYSLQGHFHHGRVHIGRGGQGAAHPQQELDLGHFLRGDGHLRRDPGHHPHQ